MRILIAEDDKTTRLILEGVVKKWGYEPLAVENGIAARDAMTHPEGPKLAIMDWSMPGMDGIEVCRLLRDKETSNPAYIILLTGKTDTEDIVRGLDAGASDYICKPYKNEELLARLRVGQRMLQLQSALNEAQVILAHQAMRDPLTNIYNRRAITDILKHELARTRRAKKSVSIAICDIDHFKQINDSHGHRTDDNVLIEFTRTVLDILRESDYLGRWGGEEFLVIAPGVNDRDHGGLFDRIRQGVEAMEIPGEDCRIRITVSIGIAIGTGHEQADEFIQAADSAMYQAKNSGRNRVVFAEPAGPGQEACVEGE
jgi:two-component system, cell cycle response regulator